jgi:hypothetical protein
VITIVVDSTGLGGSTDNIGLDNITFSESEVTAGVPEPGSLILVSLGAPILYLLLRRRSHVA